MEITKDIIFSIIIVWVMSLFHARTNQYISNIKKHEQRLEILHRQVFEFANTKTIQDMAEKTLNAIENIMGYDYTSFCVIEEDFLKIIYHRGIGTVELLSLNGPGITIRAVKTKRTQLVNDVRKDVDYVSLREKGMPEILSEIDIPIIIDDKVFAVLNVESERINAFNESEQRILEILAQHVASVLSAIIQRKKIELSIQDLERSNRELDEYSYAVARARPSRGSLPPGRP